MRIYPRENTTVIEIPALKDDAGSLVTTATVETTITLGNGDPVPGVTNPVTMTHMGSGQYVGYVPPIDLANDTEVVIKVTSEISGVTATVRETLVLKDRTFSGGCWAPV